MGGYPGAARAGVVTEPAGWPGAGSQYHAGTAAGLALAEHFGAVLGDEQRQGHGAGGGQPAAPGGAGHIHMQVQGNALVRDKPGPRRAGQQVVEQDSHFAFVLASAEHRGQRIPGLTGIGQVAATAASFKTGAYALGAAVAGLLAGALTARQLVLLVGIGQFAALAPFLPGRTRETAGAATTCPAFDNGAQTEL